jgi:UDP-GlcNAc:undecaprenyl-phosphate GlcNAc-1-phosphate transferase
MDPARGEPLETLMLLVVLAACSALIVALMVRIGALDHPVARSSHTMPTPKGGGVGMVVAFALGMALVHQAGGRDAILASAAIGLAIASYLDDVLQWPFWVKLAAQLGAALLIVASGLAPHGLFIPGIGPVALGLLAPAVACGWLLFTTNAVNFMDGLNGLAAGSAAVGCLVIVVRAGAIAAWPEAVILAAVAGFLPFNYPAARIFMGDVGSQFLGFLLAALALRHAGDPALSSVLPLSLSPMLLDVAFTLLRRWRGGARLTQAHRGHLYQVAQRSGVPAWLVSALCWAMAGWAGWCGLEMNAHATQPGSAALWLAMAIAPFAIWVAFVFAKARQANLQNW